MARMLAAAIILAAALAAAAGGIPSFDADRAWGDLLRQVEFGPRDPGSPGHAACGEWIAATLDSLGYRVERHHFSVDDPYGEGSLELTNFRAWRPDAQGPPLAFAAHWDTRPRADLDPDPARRGEPILGANDGASGVAVLMELARLCAERRPPLPVEFLFFDGEDYGEQGDLQHYLLGSTRFVRDHPSFRPRLLVLLDMVGGRDLHITMEPYSRRAAPGQLQRIFDMAEDLDLPAFVPEIGPAVWDDHIPFIRHGVPAVDLVDFRFPEWHTLADTPAACSPSSLAQVGALTARMIFETPVVW